MNNFFLILKTAKETRDNIGIGIKNEEVENRWHFVFEFYTEVFWPEWLRTHKKLNFLKYYDILNWMSKLTAFPTETILEDEILYDNDESTEYKILKLENGSYFAWYDVHCCGGHCSLPEFTVVPMLEEAKKFLSFLV